MLSTPVDDASKPSQEPEAKGEPTSMPAASSSTVAGTAGSAEPPGVVEPAESAAIPSAAAESAGNGLCAIPRRRLLSASTAAVAGWFRQKPRRELILVFAVVAALYLPRLGSFGLWDPWEGHYAEVARRMLEEGDLLHMSWQTETFYSKPPLSMWLMAASMRAFGIGKDGGYSGELVSSSLVEWSIRLPFALLGVLGVCFLWQLIARLCSRRAAWLAAAVLATSPFYFFIGRQAITDMPSCAVLIVALTLFALALLDEDRKLATWWKGLSSFHLLMVALTLVVVGQLAYFTWSLRGSRVVLAPKLFMPGPLAMVPMYLAFAALFVWTWVAARSRRRVLLYWFYVVCGLGVLAKGPVAAGLAGATILGYLCCTGEWKLLKHCEIPRGVLIGILVCVPWHIAMYIKAGNPWLNEYLGQHLINRALRGVHGDRGSFLYFVEQMGIGMWPWVAMVPAALAWLVFQKRAVSTEARVRLLLTVWAIIGFFFFSIVQTKFHHYILPAVPAFAALIGIWLADILEGKVARPAAAAAVAVTLGIFFLTSLDLIPAQQKLVQLFIYRYDRTIPRSAPWNIDYTYALLIFALAIGIALGLMLWLRLRRAAVLGIIAGATVFTLFAMDVLMVRATPHYGQRLLHETYYRKRRILGADFRYEGLRELAKDFGNGDITVRSVIPDTLGVGDSMKVTYRLEDERGELTGTVARIDRDHDAFWIAVPDSERARLAPLLERARGSTEPPRRRWVSVNAERLIARLYWRGESFYSGGEIWNRRIDDAQTVFHELNDGENKKFLEYLRAREGQGRRFWVLAEKGHLTGVRNLLPSQAAKDSFETEPESSSFFGLASFVL
ncbi:MAG: glycosyltransferase family 39 protein [Pseudomonadota bacterium]